MKTLKYVLVFGFVCFLGLSLPYLFVSTFSADKGYEKRMIEKYQCVPTNEFVGRSADRLWLCKNGLKYTEHAFHSWAYQEKQEKRGW